MHLRAVGKVGPRSARTGLGSCASLPGGTRGTRLSDVARFTSSISASSHEKPQACYSATVTIAALSLEERVVATFDRVAGWPVRILLQVRTCSSIR